MERDILKGLCDKVYEKRKAAALVLEKQIKNLANANDFQRINAIVDELCDEYFPLSVEKAVARNARLMGLATTMIALGPKNIPSYLSTIIPPILICFEDQNEQVRFYACESLYNIAKIAKGEILVYFNEIFDVLCKITSDPVSNVKNAASVLDKLIKDIVGEFGARHETVVKNDDLNDLPPATKTNSVTGEVLQERYEQDTKTLSFSLPKFIPLLQERIYTNNPNTRMFIVSWIQVIASCPDLELITYLPAFLGGLFAYLSDSHRDVRVVTTNLLDLFLQEIKRVSELKKLLAMDAASTHSINANNTLVSEANTIPATSNMKTANQNLLSTKQGFMRLSSDESSSKKLTDGPSITERKKTLINALDQWSGNGNASDGSNDGSGTNVNRYNSNKNEIGSSDSTQRVQEELEEQEKFHDQTNAQRDLNSSAPTIQTSRLGQDYVPGQNVVLDFPKFIQVLITSLNSSEPKVQVVVLKWLETILNLSPRGFISTLSNILPLLLKHLSDSNPKISEIATSINYKLIDVAGKLDEGEKINYSSMINNLSLNFKEGTATTKIACLDWLIFIYKRISATSMLEFNDGIFYILLQSMSDEDNRVISKSLALLSCICANGKNDSYFSNFVYKVLDLLKKDIDILKTRASFILRQLCLQLGAERIYKITSLTLDKWDKSDMTFIQLVIQIMSTDLITAPDLKALRKKLKKNEDWTFFSIIFKCWCYNSSSLLYLCLISENYELAYHLLQILVEQDMIESSTLIQIDVLVQYLESPVFAGLRMQLLEHQKYPYLYKCLFALLMILPQSKAYEILNNRLSSVIKLVSVTSASTSNTLSSSASSSPMLKTEHSVSTRSLSINSTSSRSITQNSFQFNDLLEYFRNVTMSLNDECAEGNDENNMPIIRTNSSKQEPAKNISKQSVSNRVSSMSKVYEPVIPMTPVTPQMANGMFTEIMPPDLPRKMSSSTYAERQTSETQNEENDNDSVVFNPAL
ncbi:hypothetical protein ACO0QE_001906 [Hanseniaspora vineae]